jgi:hypothetical protein
LETVASRQDASGFSRSDVFPAYPVPDRL